MPRRDIIVVGASAGGVEALSSLVAGFPPSLKAAVLVVLHLPPTATSHLPVILNRAGPLPALSAVDGQAIVYGRIYVAPPDYHLLLRPGHIRLTRGPRENGHRPAVDSLFRSAARVYDSRAVGVVLSGTLDDGAVGLLALKMRGGVAVVQRPDDALFSGMPASALEAVEADHVLPVSEIGPLLAELSRDEAGEKGARTMQGETGGERVEMRGVLEESNGPPSAFTCPECHGTLFEAPEGEPSHYRCRVGHTYSPNSLLQAESEALEAALWAALRALQERTDLAKRMAVRAEERGHLQLAARLADQVRDGEQSFDLLQQTLLNGSYLSSGLNGPEDALPG
ncbi:MAG: chemotaxis protein CheB [Chloroflexi bacterium]|nr:chemotaxis protein CheB [Chloroflexota bacterium]